ncbi:MAG: hypothetical protein JWP74_2476 [Marmoricola sp.]|nr:hypothetical protein [Marmoricola sp.]
MLLGAVFVIGRTTAPDHTDRTAAAHLPATPGSADIGFAQDMAVHHDQAVLMAQLAQARGTTAVRAIAEGILIGQSQEVGLLRGWLRVWGAPGVSQHPMAWMGMSMPTGSTAMPGMATSPQLQRLYNLTGRRFDVLFLQLMIRHHEGGLLMTRAVLAEHTLATTKAAARGISSEQIEELGTMRALLAADGGRTLPVPS